MQAVAEPAHWAQKPADAPKLAQVVLPRQPCLNISPRCAALSRHKLPAMTCGEPCLPRASPSPPPAWPPLVSHSSRSALSPAPPRPARVEAAPQIQGPCFTTARVACALPARQTRPAWAPHGRQRPAGRSARKGRPGRREEHANEGGGEGRTGPTTKEGGSVPFGRWRWLCPDLTAAEPSPFSP